MGSGRKHKICLIVFLIFLISCSTIGVRKKTGPLLKEEVYGQLKKISPKLEKCYERTIIDKNGFYGKGILILKIDKSGNIADYNWKPQPPDNFVICTDSIIKSIKFRLLPDTVKIELPVSFIISVEDEYEIK